MITVVAVWRVSSANFDVEDFLRRFPTLSPDAVWRRGEPRLVRGKNEDSGFNLTLAEAENGAAAISQARDALARLQPALLELRRLSVPSLVDFGLFVGGSVSFTSSVRFAPDMLQWFSEQGVGLSVSAYPVSEEDEV